VVGRNRGVEEHEEKVEEDDEKGVDLMETGLEVGEDEDAVKTSSALELPVESFS